MIVPVGRRGRWSGPRKEGIKYHFMRVEGNALELGGGNDKEKVGNDGENKCQAASESVEPRLRLAEEARPGSGARVAQVPRYLSARQPCGCLNSTP